MPDYNNDIDDQKHNSPVKQCAIMMSALILLQSCFGRADSTNRFLREDVKMSDLARESLDFVLTNCRRQLLWDEESDSESVENKLKGSLQPAWDWFKGESQNARSICGIVFRLAEMGATREVEGTTLLGQLRIGAIISRRSTGELEDDGDDVSD